MLALTSWIRTIVATAFSVVMAAQSVQAQPTQLLMADDLVSVGPVGWLAPNFAFPNRNLRQPIVGPRLDGPGADMLRGLWARGLASGFEGVVYENRDRGHSPLSPEDFPQLTQLKFGPKLRAQNLDYGLAGRIFLPAIVIGNSSTAITQFPIARSQTRQAMTTQVEASRAYHTYANNHLYIYPEHKDHDADDLFHANWTYTITSQGSSYSDQPFLHAILMALAALPKDTREFLRQKRLVAPTLQMILRRSQLGLGSYEAYLSGLVHPPVFDKERLDLQRMVGLAASLLPEDIPPIIKLTVEEESFTDNADLAKMSEKLFDTPSAIARVWRGSDYTKYMAVSTQNTVDPNGRDLKFRWVLLSGDPDKVRIEPEGETAARARISLDWHDTWITQSLSPRSTNRVDIGVFAWNGVHYSAPAIISVSFSNHHKRVYQPVGKNGEIKLVSIDYSARKAKRPFDPLLHWWAKWQDEFSYGTDGEMQSWTRHLKGQDIPLPVPGQQSELKAATYKTVRKKEFKQLVMQDSTN